MTFSIRRVLAVGRSVGGRLQAVLKITIRSSRATLGTLAVQGTTVAFGVRAGTHTILASPFGLRTVHVRPGQRIKLTFDVAGAGAPKVVRTITLPALTRGRLPRPVAGDQAAGAAARRTESMSPGKRCSSSSLAEPHELAGALFAIGDDAGGGEGLEVVARRRLADGQDDLSAGERVAGAASGELAHDLQPYRIGERVQHGTSGISARSGMSAECSDGSAWVHVGSLFDDCRTSMYDARRTIRHGAALRQFRRRRRPSRSIRMSVSASPPTTATAGSDRLSRRAWGALLVLCGALFLDALDVSMIGVALPSIRTDLGMSTELAAVGRERVRARLRRLPAPRRPRRRPARPPADVPDLARRLPRRLRPRRPGERRHAADRNPLHQGRERGVHGARRPLDHHDELRRGRRRATARSPSTRRPGPPGSRSASCSAAC